MSKPAFVPTPARGAGELEAPSAPRAPTIEVLSLDVVDVEFGDVLVGFPDLPAVERISFVAGCWVLADDRDVILKRIRLGGRVQVVRPLSTGDLCPPHGIDRPLRLVR